MSWKTFRVHASSAYHTDSQGKAVYDERFDEVLKFHKPGLAPVSKGGAAWHIRPDGSPAYERRFLRCFGFYEGLAAVTHEQGWYHIEPSGDALYTERYAWCGNFQGGRCSVRLRNGCYGYLDRKGRFLSERPWHYAGDYRDGIAVVQTADGLSTHVDMGEAFVHGRCFLDLDVYHKGFARARDEKGWCHIDKEGRAVYDARFASVEPFYNGQARVECFDGSLEVIDEQGNTLHQLRPARRSHFAQLSSDMVGFWRTHTIAAAVQLGVLESLPGSIDVIASQAGMQTNRARRLFRALGELALVSECDGVWSLQERGSFLKRDHPLTLAGAALEYAGPFSAAWAKLPLALLAEPGWRVPDVFADVARDKARCEAHHQMLRSYALHDYEEIAKVLPCREHESVIDVGGGLGEMARMIARHHSPSKITVFERPEVVELGRTACQDSVLTWHTGDFFEDWGMKADLVVLARVLHDWDDQKALQILRRAKEALRPQGRVAIVEMLLSEEGYGGALCDLHLLAVTGGRERTLACYEKLLAQAGFCFEQVDQVQALPSLVLGRVAS